MGPMNSMSDDKMALSRIRITTDVFNVCMSHALLTDSEEVMGLLLGDTIVRVRFAGGHSPGPDPSCAWSAGCIPNSRDCKHRCQAICIRGIQQ